MPYVWQIPKFVRSYLRYIWQSCFEKPDLEVYSPNLPYIGEIRGFEAQSG